MKKNIQTIYKLAFLLVSFGCFSTSLYAQENCGNGIDDDGDGLVDCLDSDCVTNIVPSGETFNTANDGSGGVLNGGLNDFNWSISVGSINGTYNPAVVMTSLPGNYYSSPWPNCSWISHSSSGTHSVNTDYFYKLEILLPCQKSCGQSFSDSAIFCLDMEFFADNAVEEIYVNGEPQSSIINGIPVSSPYYHEGFKAANKVGAELCNNWIPGTNELIVKISSGPGYEGFLAQYNTSASAVEPIAPLEEFIIPNVFTPNGDNDNDEFQILGADLAENYNIKIFNRWGTQVFESSNAQIHWDGGKQNEGIYYYVLTYTETCKEGENTLTGYITLLK